MTVWIQNPFDNLPAEGFRKQRYWLMAEAFVRAGHRVILWTADFNHTTKARRILQMDGFARFEVRLVPTPPYRKNVSRERVRSHRAYAEAWERLATAEVAREAAARPGLIVTSIPTISGAEAALRLGRGLGARVVVDVQDAWPETFERLAPHGFGWLARLALSGWRKRARRVYRDADLVTGVCDRYRALVGREDYFRAYLGAELSADAEARQETGSSSVRLVYAGNLGVSYDLGTVIRGLGEGQALDVAGKGQEEPKWRRLAAELGLSDRVTFHGYLDESALRRLMSSCDVGIVPMADDSFVGVPNKFCEYAAAGLRIVSSLGGESADLLKRYSCGATYAPGNAAGFAEAVRRAAEQSAEAALELARREFDAVRIYDGYVKRCLD